MISSDAEFARIRHVSPAHAHDIRSAAPRLLASRTSEYAQRMRPARRSAARRSAVLAVFPSSSPRVSLAEVGVCPRELLRAKGGCQHRLQWRHFCRPCAIFAAMARHEAAAIRHEIPCEICRPSSRQTAPVWKCPPSRLPPPATAWGSVACCHSLRFSSRPHLHQVVVYASVQRLRQPNVTEKCNAGVGIARALSPSRPCTRLFTGRYV